MIGFISPTGCRDNSASEAVRCAMEIQLELQREPQVPLRIGINIGEIFFDNGKVLGDGVNVASRIESMGVAGAVLFSREVYSKIRNRSEFRIKSLGAFEFKNVDEKIDVFALKNDGLLIPDVKHISFLQFDHMERSNSFSYEKVHQPDDV